MEVGLNQIGIKTKSTLNSLKIFGNPNIKINKTIKIFPKNDHRIAMSFFCF
jgi:5-enolpyruvylshikimate-3-phosphate synthase